VHGIPIAGIGFPLEMDVFVEAKRHLIDHSVERSDRVDAAAEHQGSNHRSSIVSAELKIHARARWHRPPDLHESAGRTEVQQCALMARPDADDGVDHHGPGDATVFSSFVH
jgi:hypothetical protein